jgi:hypothetical protein
MDTARKFAYRQLMYLAMNDIRSISGLVDPPDRLLNPATSKDALAWIVRAGDIANWLENLAGFSSDEFEGFDEDRFWREHAKVSDSFPDVAAYRGFFEQRVKDFLATASAG